ncbi:hypothetical protein DPEC_G00075870 [Dallia pectoralis]|uniref:Uncharacterized protein n=1 Tax=Dallia pectoralis TaxID=75939 RepID=A0ACC2H3A4_DALPE|nr:hypothetical protein DPEC_G00075870 [Dallia pectoralis]
MRTCCWQLCWEPERLGAQVKQLESTAGLCLFTLKSHTSETPVSATLSHLSTPTPPNNHYTLLDQTPVGGIKRRSDHSFLRPIAPEGLRGEGRPYITSVSNAEVCRFSSADPSACRARRGRPPQEVYDADRRSKASAGKSFRKLGP